MAIATQEERLQRGLKGVALWSCILAIATLAGVYAISSESLALALAGLLVVASIVILKGDLPDRFGNHSWIPWAWIALFVSAGFRFHFTSTLDTSASAVSPENRIQMVVYATVAILVVHSRGLLVARDRSRIRKGLLLAWPLLAVVSAIWSPVPLFTLVRALQLCVTVGLALVMVRIWVASPETGARLWKATLRLFVQAVTVLVLIGFAAPGEGQRFTWPGAHPIVATTYVALALLVLLGYGRSFLRLRTSGYIVRMMLFGAAIFRGETRGTLGGLLVAVAVLLWFAGRRKPLTRYLGLLYYGTALILLLTAAFPATLHYLERGGTTAGLATLNGRIGLWQAAIDVLSSSGKWITGFGYGAARVILPTQVHWAGTGHSFWVELVMGLGIPGVLLAAADILFLFRYLSSRSSVTPPAATVGLLTFLVVNAVVSDVAVFPGVGFGMLALLHVPILAQLSSTRPLVRGPTTPRNLRSPPMESELAHHMV